jgi:hypothetical protein
MFSPQNVSETVMKLIKLTIAGLIFAGTAYAGNLVFEAPVEAEVESEPAGSMGGSGAWLIPLLAIGLVALAVSSSDDAAS